mmetsp:Transcript_17321/g.48255  ORF Transcript_17321/g.48255 Transcript_17321/m.48255 type:complete len:172 (-) Transcript_17321:124-639(-)
MATPRVPNVLITGTPGTGKTTMAAELARLSGWQHINVGDWVKEQELHCGWDNEYECWVLDEDKVCDAMEDTMVRGGCIVDHHTCDFFPERWFQLVVVLTTDNSVLYDRLSKRGYSGKKLEGNIECEIMMVIQEEAMDSYREEIVQVLPNNTVEEMEDNIGKTAAWISQASR